MDLQNLLTLILLINLGIVDCNYHKSESQPEDGHLMSATSRISRLRRLHRREPDIPLQFLGSCGIPPRVYDTRVRKCKDYVILPVSDPSTHVTQTQVSVPQTPSCSEIDLIFCNDKIHCGAQRGYKCCGFELYHPDSQTCCQKTSTEYSIHDSMQEKSHICCGVDVFNRGDTNLPCEHSSFNEKFLRKLPKLKTLKDNVSPLCSNNDQEQKYVYKIDIEDSITDSGRLFLKAKISMWPLDSTNSYYNKQYFRSDPAKQGVMKIPLDGFSPLKKNVKGKRYFTITNKNYLQKAVFFLSPKDILYRLPRSKKGLKNLRRLFRKIQRKCAKRHSLH